MWQIDSAWLAVVSITMCSARCKALQQTQTLMAQNEKSMIFCHHIPGPPPHSKGGNITPHTGGLEDCT
jgi:hypothetical protein